MTSIVLRTHLTYIREACSHVHAEEQWIFEALTKAYLPLFLSFEKLLKEKIPFQVTCAVSPTLLSLLDDSFMMHKYYMYLTERLHEIDHDLTQSYDTLSLSALKRMKEEIHSILHYLKENEQLILRMRFFQDSGQVEWIICTATNAYLPYFISDECKIAQLRIGIDTFYHYFETLPPGVWLSSFDQVIDRTLHELGVKYVILDPSEQADYIKNEKQGEQLAISHHGILLCKGSSPLIMSEINNIQLEKMIAPFIRKCEKEYFSNLEQQGIKFQVLCYDIELFGEWWIEGKDFITALFRYLQQCPSESNWIVPSQMIEELESKQLAPLKSISTMNIPSYNQKRINQQNHWIYRHLHQAEKRFLELARHSKIQDHEQLSTAFKQGVKELLLAQSGDWPLLMNHASLSPYAIQRFILHLSRFNQLYDQIKSGNIDMEQMDHWQYEYPLFDKINLKDCVISQEASYVAATLVTKESNHQKLRILMLAWEYPPRIIGGLARAVHDLSVELVKQGLEVHVLTCQVKGLPTYELIQGIHIHRVDPLVDEHQIEFTQWIFQLNMQLIDCGRALSKSLSFDLIHAHDWLVTWAAKEMKHTLSIPLIATIHATEYGRNQGLWTDQQRKINHLEWELTYEAQSVIVCSQYMKAELHERFQLPQDKIKVISNGIDPTQVMREGYSVRYRFALPHEKIILFVGRMVREKGLHILLQAIPRVLQEVPEAKFILCGKGPMLQELSEQVMEMGLSHKIYLPGFIDESTKHTLLQESYACVFPSIYEPFGIVALEAMYSNGLAIVSDTGGLGEIIEHQCTGLKAYPGHVQSLYDQLLYALQNEEQMRRIRAKARQKVIECFQWDVLAKETIHLYRNHLKEVKEVVQL